MKRRNFIVLGAAGAAAVGTSYWYVNYYEGDIKPVLTEPQDLSSIWDTSTIIRIGSEYRKQNPEEDNKKDLIKLIRTHCEAGMNEVAGLKEGITKDFLTGNTVEVDGWILSATEGRQCALYSLIQSN